MKTPALGFIFIGILINSSDSLAACEKAPLGIGQSCCSVSTCKGDFCIAPQIPTGCKSGGVLQNLGKCTDPNGAGPGVLYQCLALHSQGPPPIPKKPTNPPVEPSTTQSDLMKSIPTLSGSALENAIQGMMNNKKNCMITSPLDQNILRNVLFPEKGVDLQWTPSKYEYWNDKTKTGSGKTLELGSKTFTNAEEALHYAKDIKTLGLKNVETGARSSGGYAVWIKKEEQDFSVDEMLERKAIAKLLDRSLGSSIPWETYYTDFDRNLKKRTGMGTLKEFASPTFSSPQEASAFISKLAVAGIDEGVFGDETADRKGYKVWIDVAQLKNKVQSLALNNLKNCQIKQPECKTSEASNLNTLPGQKQTSGVLQAIQPVLKYQAAPPPLPKHLPGFNKPPAFQELKTDHSNAISTYHQITPQQVVKENMNRSDLYKRVDQAYSEMKPNKQYIFKKIFKPNPNNKSEVSYGKYQLSSSQKSALNSLKLNFNHPTTQINQVESVFNYPSSPQNEAHYTVNFADKHLFSYWKGDLFAQDEMQVAEHPELGLLREKWITEGKSDYATLDTKTSEIALIQGVKRFGKINSDGIYGGKFQQASKQTLDQKVTAQEPTPSNIIAMAAPHVSPPGNYSKETIHQIFMTAYTAFSAAKKESAGKKLTIDTGNWGTGAFGNDPKLMAILQILAAQSAGVDKLNYHTVTPEWSTHLQEAQQWIKNKTAQFKGKDPTLENWLSEVFNSKFKYRNGNGT